MLNNYCGVCNSPIKIHSVNLQVQGTGYLVCSERCSNIAKAFQQRQEVIKGMKVDNLLSHARSVYGDKQQVVVVIEELNELACVLAKFVRYETTEKAVEALDKRVVEELADVYITLKHIEQIFNVKPQRLEAVKQTKINRLERWLENSTSMEYTTEDRNL